MHKDFSEWYRAAGIDPVAEAVPKRWLGVENYSPEALDIITLTKFFYGLGHPNEVFISTLREAFQKEDVTFPMQKNDVELRVLAGAVLIDVIEHGDKDLAMLSALSLVSTSFQNLRKGACVPAIPNIAALYLYLRTSDRANPPEKHASSSLFTALDELGEPYDALALELTKVQLELSVVSEETNMLWWLFSESSRDLSKHWSGISLPAATIIAGKELADLTHILPGPMSALAFLDKIIRLAKTKPPATITIKDAINEIPLDLRRKYLSPGCVSDLDAVVPLSCGIKVSVGSPENESWVPAFVTATKVAAEAKLAPNLVSYQMFVERMLLQALNQSTKP